MKTFIAIFIAIIFFSCSNPSSQKTNDAAAGSTRPVPDRVMTAERQKQLTPDSVIAMLKEGNQRFSDFKPYLLNDSLRVHVTASGQYPMGAVLSCLDSRIPVEGVFNMGVGDLFVARVAGNIGNEDIWGSLEYATYVVGAKLILVLGHEECGAIKSAIDTVKMGNITALLAKIRPAVDSVKMPGDRNSENKKFVHAVMVKNIELTIKKMRKESPTIAKLEQEKKIKIIGGIYDVASGKITFL